MRVSLTYYILFTPMGGDHDTIVPTVQLMEDRETKGERRDDKQRKRRKMRVVGRSVRLLQQIIRRKAEDAHKKDQQ